MTNTTEATIRFFDRYAAALLARDATTIAGLYAVPALILFPGHSIAVSDSSQTEEFFAGGWGQYDGVDTIEKSISVILEGPGTVWADVTWTYGDVSERFCYQLIDQPDGPQIAVLTPLT